MCDDSVRNSARRACGAGCYVTCLSKLTRVPTKEMEADMLTKPLDDATFERHRDTVMNTAAGRSM